MGWSARNCSDSINKSRRVVQIMTKMIKAAVSMRVCRKGGDWWYTGCFAEQLCYSSCNILLQALIGAQELMARVTITLIDSTCSIKRCYSIPTEMKMIENTKKCLFWHYTGKKYKHVYFSFPHWANSKVPISTTHGFALNNSHLEQENKFQKADEKGSKQSGCFSIPSTRSSSEEPVRTLRSNNSTTIFHQGLVLKKELLTQTEPTQKQKLYVLL